MSSSPQNRPQTEARTPRHQQDGRQASETSSPPQNRPVTEARTPRHQRDGRQASQISPPPSLSSPTYNAGTPSDQIPQTPLRRSGRLAERLNALPTPTVTEPPSRGASRTQSTASRRGNRVPQRQSSPCPSAGTNRVRATSSRQNTTATNSRASTLAPGRAVRPSQSRQTPRGGRREDRTASQGAGNSNAGTTNELAVRPGREGAQSSVQMLEEHSDTFNHSIFPNESNNASVTGSTDFHDLYQQRDLLTPASFRRGQRAPPIPPIDFSQADLSRVDPATLTFTNINVGAPNDPSSIAEAELAAADADPFPSIDLSSEPNPFNPFNTPTMNTTRIPPRGSYPISPRTNPTTNQNQGTNQGPEVDPFLANTHLCFHHLCPILHAHARGPYYHRDPSTLTRSRHSRWGYSDPPPEVWFAWNRMRTPGPDNDRDWGTVNGFAAAHASWYY